MSRFNRSTVISNLLDDEPNDQASSDEDTTLESNDIEGHSSNSSFRLVLSDSEEPSVCSSSQMFINSEFAASQASDLVGSSFSMGEASVVGCSSNMCGSTASVIPSAFTKSMTMHSIKSTALNEKLTSTFYVNKPKEPNFSKSITMNSVASSSKAKMTLFKKKRI